MFEVSMYVRERSVNSETETVKVVSIESNEANYAKYPLQTIGRSSFGEFDLVLPIFVKKATGDEKSCCYFQKLLLTRFFV